MTPARQRTSTVILMLFSTFALAAFAQTEERGAIFSVTGADFKASDSKTGILTITVKNYGELSGTATLVVSRTYTRCLRTDPNYCSEHPAAAGDPPCVDPCMQFESRDLGVDRITTPTIKSCDETRVTLTIPNETSDVEMLATPGSSVPFGIEIRPESR
ncbi:MAG: hypothetical protein WBX15_01160 [Thermoanaerobaculia bacterium]